MRCGSVAVLALALGATVVPTGTSYALETCHGQTATVVGIPGVPSVEGTEGPDVIASNGAQSVRAHGGDDLVCVTGRTYRVDGDEGNDTIDATQRTGNGRTELGAGADTFTGGPGREWVDDGQGLDRGSDRDEIRVGDGARVETGFPGSENNDIVIVGGAGGEQSIVLYAGYQGPTGTLHFAGGRNHLSMQGVDNGSPDWLIDNRQHQVTGGGQPWLTWTGQVSRFTVIPDPVPGSELTVTFLGTAADEAVASFGFVRLDAHLGAGADRIEAFCGYRPGSRAVLGRGRDTVVVGLIRCQDRTVRLDRAELLPDLRIPRAEVVVVNGDDYLVHGSEHAEVMKLKGCRGEVRAAGGDDRLETDGGQCLGGPGFRLYGGAGADRLTGGRLNDLLVGGAGRDEADGNRGTDTCRAETTKNCEKK